MKNKTKSTTKEDALKNRRWVLVDAENKVLGRLASGIATVLRGKDQVTYTPHVDVGSYVIVVNAGKVRLTGKKEENKMYHHHTGWVGGVVERNAATLRAEEPEALLEKAIKGMLPKGPLGRAMFAKLKLYAASEHPHAAQQPEVLAI